LTGATLWRPQKKWAAWSWFNFKVLDHSWKAGSAGSFKTWQWPNPCIFHSCDRTLCEVKVYAQEWNGSPLLTPTRTDHEDTQCS
jgi:hypothetical protein